MSKAGTITKWVATLGLGFCAFHTWSDMHETQQTVNGQKYQISMYKQQATQKVHSPRQKVMSNAYQKSEATGNKIVKMLQSTMSIPYKQRINDAKFSKMSAQMAKYTKGDGSTLANSNPPTMTQGHIAFSHGGLSSDGTVKCAFIWYDQSNQMQQILTCDYDSNADQFEDFHVIYSDSVYQAHAHARQGSDTAPQDQQNNNQGAKK